MDKIRIAHVAGGLTVGGVEAVLYNYFSHMDANDYELFYLSYDTPDSMVKEKFEKLGFKIYTITKKKENLIKSCMEVYRIFKDNHIQIVHSHMTLMCFITNIIGMLTGAKVRISHSHLVVYGSGLKKYIYACFKFLSRVTATDFFACSDDAALCLFSKKEVENGKVVILKNAVDIEAFKYNKVVRESIREEYKIGNKTVIGHVGRYTEQKNHKFLIEVFNEYHKKNPQSVLLLVGSGSLMENTMEQIRKYRLEEDVIIAGATNSVEKFYQAMDVFVFPSLYEGLGIVAIEAQIAGLCVVTSDVVPREVAFSDKVSFLPLNISASEWADNIQNMLMKKRSFDVKEKLVKNGYDICVEAVNLDRFYKEKMGDRGA